MIVTSSAAKTVSKGGVNFASWSWIRKWIGSCSSSMVHRIWRAAPRGYPVTQEVVGLSVQPATWTQRLPSSIKNNTYRVCNQAVSTVKVADLLTMLPPPFAICAFNDEVALAALCDLTIAVPEAVTVIAHDNIPLAEMSIPPLTTVCQETLDFAERLIASGISVCQGGSVLDTSVFNAKVVVRASA